jgi:hypothetical protein
MVHSLAAELQVWPRQGTPGFDQLDEIDVDRDRIAYVEPTR